ncbi:hypothetical protein MAR_029076 [Mya arenaria]|uniref:Uncharacterized protein n=1 Tax=Mya arenaria TaxID=6604 RepID=A0ABY7DHC9_MYAAR|nr:hypothetical protein MAR_029076 [Mya arenaria]
MPYNVTADAHIKTQFSCRSSVRAKGRKNTVNLPDKVCRSPAEYKVNVVEFYHQNNSISNLRKTRTKLDIDETNTFKFIARLYC